MATGASIASAVIAAIGTTVSVQQNRKAQKAREKADAVGQAQAQLENQRNIRQAVAASRLRQAQVAALGEAQGAGDSSGIAGALGSAQTQAAANIGFARQTLAANSAQNQAFGQARAAQTRSANAQAIGALPGQFGFSPDVAAQILAKDK